MESNIPTILTVFGATGDLMARKIVPSLYHLRSRGLLPDHFHVIGFSRRDWSDGDLRQHVCDIIAERYPGDDPADVREFCQQFTYQRGSFEQADAYVAAEAHLQAIDDRWGVCANKLFYLAVPPEHYSMIFHRLSASGLTEACSDMQGWTRVLVEKPFGDDVDTAKELDDLLGSLFREEQIYRIDHYLAKEMLQGILNFRFTNNLFENAWDRSTIESIDIKLLETLGVEKRGRFYDGVGALRDVGQNHLLQMLALVTMEQPVSLGAAAIREARAQAVGHVLRPMTHEQIVRDSYRAQYEGFREIEGVSPSSVTESYFKLRTTLRGQRWAGVPVTMESGKRMAEVCKEIVVTFKHPDPCMCDGGQHVQNRITFRLEPNDSITIHFWAKKPGFSNELEEREFYFFLYEKVEKAQYVEEYARLILDAVRGDQTLFVSTDEIRAMWEFIDPVVDEWRDGSVPLGRYSPDDPAVHEAADLVLSNRKGTSVLRPSVGVVGLGKMGAGIARNLMDHGWRVVGYNRTIERAQEMEGEGLKAAISLGEFVSLLPAPRIVWLMVPAGKPVDAILFDKGGLLEYLDPGDTVIDGGNSNFRSDAARAAKLAATGIAFLDCGTSGGPSGARHGACLMIGGRRDAFELVEALFADIAAPGGYQFFEGAGAGHFVKMVHNGIEYGMMQAIAEGFQIMRQHAFRPDLLRVADVYQNTSVIESRLVGWLYNAYLEMGPDLAGASGMVGHTGEGAWTVDVAKDMGLPVPIIEGALRFRVESERNPSYAGQVLSALRNQFGGHAID
ncbi:MAG: glucose-6-phosphate dehydrogenase [Actinomycetota bacterium]|jgi:glucose-6-phosphate 1-dehydrogenase|nr:glucose-6-phosphate dehydrogenase [Actinomycetota bacterium]